MKKTNKTSLWRKVRDGVSDLFNEDEQENKPDENGDDEFCLDISIDFSKLWSKKYYIIAALIVIIALVYLFKDNNVISGTGGESSSGKPVFLPVYENGTYLDQEGKPFYESPPVLKYNPSIGYAQLFVEEALVRHNKNNGDYADLMYCMGKGVGKIPSKEDIGNVFKEVPNSVDILVEEEILNYNDQPYDVVIHTSIPLKKAEGNWTTTKFKLNLLEDFYFVILWNEIEEFPMGTLASVSLVYSDEI